MSIGLYAGALAARQAQQQSRALIRQACYFLLGWLVLALMSPLDALGGALFSAHMVQHALLMIVAAIIIPACRAVWAR